MQTTTLLYSAVFAVGLMSFTPAFGADQGEIGRLLEQRLGGEIAGQAQEEKEKTQEEQAKAREEQAIIAKGKRLAIMTEGNAVLKALDTLQSSIVRWEKQIQDLLTNAEGQALASDPVNVENFVNLRDVDRYSLDQVDGVHTQIQSLLSPAQTASDSSLYIPTDAVVKEIRDAGKQIKETLHEYERLQVKLKVLLQRSKGVSVSVNAPTLATAIEQVAEAQARRELDAQQVARNKALAESQQLIINAEAKKLAAGTELKIQKIDDATKALKEEKEIQKDEAARQRLITQATSPLTLSRFQPFLAQGHNGLRGSSCRWGEHTIHSEPVSYADILACRVLEDVKIFARYASDPKNDRPKWKKPLTDKDWDDVEKRLEEFNKYYEIWMEKGLLGK